MLFITITEHKKIGGRRIFRRNFFFAVELYKTPYRKKKYYLFYSSFEKAFISES